MWLLHDTFTVLSFEEENSKTVTARTSHQTGSPTLHKEYIRTRNQTIGAKMNLRQPRQNQKENVIYQINCNHRNKFYVGQTGRKLCIRIKEHNATVRRIKKVTISTWKRQNVWPTETRDTEENFWRHGTPRQIRSTGTSHWIQFTHLYVQKTNTSTGTLMEERLLDSQTKTRRTPWSQINKVTPLSFERSCSCSGVIIPVSLHQREALDSSFALIRAHQQCTPMGVPGLEPRTSDMRGERATTTPPKHTNVFILDRCDWCARLTERRPSNCLGSDNRLIRQSGLPSQPGLTLAYGDTRHGREFLEAWYSTADLINRCIRLDPIYAPLRAKDQHLNRNTQGVDNHYIFIEEKTHKFAENSSPMLRLIRTLTEHLQTIGQGRENLICILFTKLNIHLLLECVFLNFPGYSLTVSQPRANPNPQTPDANRIYEKTYYSHAPSVVSTVTLLVVIRLTDYIPRNPRVWFHQVESVFTTRRTTSQATRFSYVVQHLPFDVATEVDDLLKDIPKENPYDALLVAVISRTGKSENKMLRDLFTTVELGDRSPSQLFRRMRPLASDGNHGPTMARQTSTLHAPRHQRFR
ncbi:hypothetical protein T265_04610 [Opisthorchis viverrini]|uniref:DUF7041 domain-containing protein n=1 Tax=Opisthorchis viverrini TaxID=6198 RepID=A0A074ZRV6_OPIVI|nr:hypothetical protein T265_04610 [Opisthorchis viverrini]KER28562.1 hypothetical protein T265_04610 [Opisthorchis viverrini]